MGGKHRASGKSVGGRPIKRPPEWVAARRLKFEQLLAEEAARADALETVFEAEESLAALLERRGETMPGRTAYSCPDQHGIVCSESCAGCGGIIVSELVEAMIEVFDLESPIRNGTVREYYLAHLPADLHSEDLAAIVGVETIGPRTIEEASNRSAMQQAAARQARLRAKRRLAGVDRTGLFGVRPNVRLDEEVFPPKKRKLSGFLAELKRRRS